jgi:hypothetical protein
MSIFTAINQQTANDFVRNGLVFYVDSNNATSYPGSGTSCFQVPNLGLTPRTGTLQNGVTFSSQNGGTFSLASANSRYITFSDTGLPAGQTARTLSVWLYNNNTNGNSIWYGTGAPNQGIGMQQLNSNGTVFRFYGYANDYDITVTSTQGNMWNRWTNMVGTFDGTNAGVYLNGEFMGSSNRSGWNTVLGGTLALGATVFSGSPGNYVNGFLPTAQIYNRVLSFAEIRQNYNFFKPRFLN